MITSSARLLLPNSSALTRIYIRHINKFVPDRQRGHPTNQLEYVKSLMKNQSIDWTVVKNNVLNIPGSINNKNVDGVLLKVMVNEGELDAALSFAEHLKTAGNLSLGSINGLLGLYHKIGLENQLSDKDKSFILESYKNLYEKYKVLDTTTSEKILHALCAIEEWKKALKVLDDIHLSGKPTHSAYSTLIATLFKINKKNEAMKLVERSINDQRPLLHVAYQEWIEYILRKYKNTNIVIKYLDEILSNISKNCVNISEETAVKLKETYTSLGWNAHFTKIRKQDGQCMMCKKRIDSLKLSEDEFLLLQKNIKEKLIVGSDLFLKTSPVELDRFFKFLERTTPYDIVIDALNVAFSVGKNFNNNRMAVLTTVVQHFGSQNKKILLLGRQHMLKWPNMKYLLQNTCNFFIDNLSQDDPFFITAAILSGAHTDIVSKDLLRTHRFQLQDDHLRFLFQKWQWQHQWMVFAKPGSTIIQAPLTVTPCAQKKNSCWHLPYDREDLCTAGRVKDGTPDWSSWLCLHPSSS